jgi:hypothetical protein
MAKRGHDFTLRIAQPRNVIWSLERREEARKPDSMFKEGGKW